MKNKLRSSLLMVLVMALVIQLFPMRTYAAENRTEDKTGYIPVEAVEVELGEEDVLQAYTAEKQASDNRTYATSWSSYESRYYYNLLTPEKRALYDAFYVTCMDLLTTQTDAENIGGYWTTGMVEYTGLGFEAMVEVVNLFTLSNPQFYFLQGTSTVYGSVDGRYYTTLIVYPDYTSGAVREAYTSQFVNKVNGWINTINTQSEDYSKAKTAHDIVCNNVRYDYSSDGMQHQSSATAVFDGLSVCAGYAQLYSLLCNAAGIETICVTSSTHEWNQIFVDGRWYAVDCTWDDREENGIWYDYFMVDGDSYEMSDSDHAPEPYLWPYRPACVDNRALKSVGVYLWQYENGKIEGGAVVNEDCDKATLEYRYLVYDVKDNAWIMASDWSSDYGIHFYPNDSGDYLVQCEVRDNKGTIISTVVGVNYRHAIEATCQIPYAGNQYLIGVSSFDNPNNEYSYEMLILNCDLFLQGLPAWEYTTGALKAQGNTMWTTWAPKPGSYWTLFRVYDENGAMLDEVCYGFIHQG